jgi:hypothetical protein
MKILLINSLAAFIVLNLLSLRFDYGTISRIGFPQQFYTLSVHKVSVGIGISHSFNFSSFFICLITSCIIGVLVTLSYKFYRRRS